jgi:hypothetical protein
VHEVAKALEQVGRVHALAHPGVHRASTLEQLHGDADHVTAGLVRTARDRGHGAAVATAHGRHAATRERGAQGVRLAPTLVVLAHGAAAEYGHDGLAVRGHGHASGSGIRGSRIMP